MSVFYGHGNLRCNLPFSERSIYLWIQPYFKANPIPFKINSNTGVTENIKSLKCLVAKTLSSRKKVTGLFKLKNELHKEADNVIYFFTVVKFTCSEMQRPSMLQVSEF